MADTPDLASCLADADGTLLPTSPYQALHYHFGMLLGVDDFETEQAYHRGKMRLHNAWLHREGVVWGLGVRADIEHDEIRVARGLGLDAAGHELHLDEDACVNVPAWFAKLPEADRLQIGGAAGTDPFDAHVIVRHKACLTRQVPALMEPCDGSGRDTAYSRVFETVELLLVPGPAPTAAPLPYHRLRLLFGLEPARTDDGGAPLTEDSELLAARDAMLALPREDRLPEALRLLHDAAARDGATLAPATSAEGEEWLLFPGADDAPLVLADLSEVTLAVAGDGFKLAAAQVDYAPRPSHIATRTIQDLLAGAFFCCAGTGDSHDPAPAPAPSPSPAMARAGTAPSFDPASVVFQSRKVTLRATRDLLAETVVPEAFTLAHVAPGKAWKIARISAAAYDASTRTVTLDLSSALSVGAGGVARLVASGQGATPILGADLMSPAADFVHMHKGS